MVAVTEYPDEDELRIVAALLDAGADPNAVDNSGMTAMDHAIFYQPSFSVVNMLLDAGFDLHREREISILLLSEALLYDEPAIVRRLIDLGVDPDQSQFGGGTSLEEQIEWGGGTVENVKLLLEVGADPNRPDKAGHTPLLVAVKKRRSEAVKLLIEHGAEPDSTDPAGRTAMQLARRYGYWEVVEVLGGRRPAAGLAKLRTVVGFFVRIFD